jgi:hypothetical protein
MSSLAEKDSLAEAGSVEATSDEAADYAACRTLEKRLTVLFADDASAVAKGTTEAEAEGGDGPGDNDAAAPQMIRLAVAFSRLAEAVHDDVLGEEATVFGVMIDINMIMIIEKQRNGWACPRTPSHGHPAAGVG